MATGGDVVYVIIDIDTYTPSRKAKGIYATRAAAEKSIARRLAKYNNTYLRYEIVERKVLGEDDEDNDL